MTPSIDKAAFAILVRQSGVAFSDAEITTLYEGYGYLERLVADLGQPGDAASEPALIFRPDAR